MSSAESTEGTQWVVGIDPDLSGAIALLKTGDSGSSAQVLTSPVSLSFNFFPGENDRFATCYLVAKYPESGIGMSLIRKI